MRTLSVTAIVVILALSYCPFSIQAQEEGKEKEEGYEFTTVHEVKTTPVKDQHRSGTCWSFAVTSFIETEILRISGDETDLSEMYFVRYAFEDKARRYVRYHGTSNFSPGGQAHDVTKVATEHGLITEDAYSGLTIGEEKHNHGEMDAVLKGFVEAVVKRRGGKITPVWFDAYRCILDQYLGVVPDAFDYNGSEYTPVAFMETTGFDPDDYIELTSYTHHPFYEAVNLEIPDNWSDDLYYNVTVDELLQTIDNALENGYSVCWDGDVSDKGFSHKNGVAIVPEMNVKDLTDTEMSRWEDLTESEKQEELYSFDRPRAEKEITQEMRQLHFDNYTSTDDHLMHLTAIEKDQEGTKYYRTKNSWDTDSNEFGGYLNMSEAYVRLNTIAIMVHKDAVPASISKKLGL